MLRVRRQLRRLPVRVALIRGHFDNHDPRTEEERCSTKALTSSHPSASRVTGVRRSRTQAVPWSATVSRVDRYETRDYSSSENAAQAAWSEIDFLRVKRHFER